MNPALPRVSIVLPNYNYARYLPERLESLLQQTWTDFELVIVDDASTDDSRAVIAPYTADPRVRTHCYDQNSGHTYRRWNDGAALARGEFLLFAGADDSCEPQLLTTLVSMLDAHPECVVAHARSQVIDERGHALRLRPKGARWDVDFVAGGAQEAVALLTENTIPNASAALIRRAAFHAVGGFDLRLRLSADHLCWARLLRHGSLAYTATPLNRWRTHPRTVRRSMGADRHLAEWYVVVGDILSHDVVSPADGEAALQHLFEAWTTRVGRGTLTPRGARAALAAARVVDRRLWSRVAGQGPRNVARFLRRLVTAA